MKTATDAIEELRRVVAGNEEIVALCKYQSDGKPICGVGEVLFRWGVSMETLKVMDRVGSNNIDALYNVEYPCPERADVRETLINLMDSGAVDVLRVFQQIQDNGIENLSDFEILKASGLDLDVEGISEGSGDEDRQWGVALAIAEDAYKAIAE